MALANINAWISGETEGFFDPRQRSSTTASVSTDSGRDGLGERASFQKFVPLLVAGFIGALASVSMVYFAIVVRDPIEISRGGAKPQPSTEILAKGGGVLERAGGSGPITASPTAIPAIAVPTLNQQTTVRSDRRPMAPRQEKKPARQRASRHDRPRDAIGDQAEREETARLMRDELRQSR